MSMVHIANNMRFRTNRTMVSHRFKSVLYLGQGKKFEVNMVASGIAKIGNLPGGLAHALIAVARVRDYLRRAETRESTNSFSH